MNCPKIFITIGIGLTIAACSKQASPQLPPAGNSGPEVYVTGSSSDFAGGSFSAAGYWRNDMAFALQGAQFTTAISLADATLYVAGNAGYSMPPELGGGTANEAVYWKNGVLHKLGNPPSYASAMQVVGTDVYIAGNAWVNESYQAVYWKNGVLVPLGRSRTSTANGIAVSGNDVYVSGYAENFTDTAVYWKNGVQIALDNGRSRANAIAVSGNDVYVAGSSLSNNGNLNAQATLWKNGQRQSLLISQDTSMYSSYANGIVVKGTDVHVIGWIYQRALYWKNGALTYLNNSEFTNVTQNANTIAVTDTAVYISLNTAGYWRNGQIVNVGSGYATSVYVKTP